MTILETANWLKSQDDFLILTHKNPDGDTTGCAVALCLGLRALGKTAYIYENPQFTPRQLPFLEGLTTTDTNRTTWVSVDIADRALFIPELAEQVEKVALAIDHHGSHRPFAPQILLEDTAACTEIFYDLLGAMGVALSPEMATAIYIGLATDTGRFLHSNTTSRSHQIASGCMEAGCNAYEVNQIFFGGRPLRRFYLEAKMLEHMTFLADNTVAICPIFLPWREELGLSDDDVGAVAGFTRSIEGVKVGGVFKELKDGGFKLSMRSTPAVDVSAICGHFGGGGHKAAAGATFSGTYEESLALLLEAMREEGVAV